LSASAKLLVVTTKGSVLGRTFVKPSGVIFSKKGLQALYNIYGLAKSKSDIAIGYQNI